MLKASKSPIWLHFTAADCKNLHRFNKFKTSFCVILFKVEQSRVISENKAGENVTDDECHKSDTDQTLVKGLERICMSSDFYFSIFFFFFMCNLSYILAFVYEHQQQSFSNENHSSQSSFPESKGQPNLGKLLKLQSNLV